MATMKSQFCMVLFYFIQALLVNSYRKPTHHPRNRNPFGVIFLVPRFVLPNTLHDTRSYPIFSYTYPTIIRHLPIVLPLFRLFSHPSMCQAPTTTADRGPCEFGSCCWPKVQQHAHKLANLMRCGPKTLGKLGQNWAKPENFQEIRK